MAKKELLTTEGFIEEILPDGRFTVQLDNEHKIIAYTATKVREFRIRSVFGDRAYLEMTPCDLTKGRIVFRERTPGQARACSDQVESPASETHAEKQKDRAATVMQSR